MLIIRAKYQIERKTIDKIVFEYCTINLDITSKKTILMLTKRDIFSMWKERMHFFEFIGF